MPQVQVEALGNQAHQPTRAPTGAHNTSKGGQVKGRRTTHGTPDVERSTRATRGSRRTHREEGGCGMQGTVYKRVRHKCKTEKPRWVRLPNPARKTFSCPTCGVNLTKEKESRYDCSWWSGGAKRSRTFSKMGTMLRGFLLSVVTETHNGDCVARRASPASPSAGGGRCDGPSRRRGPRAASWVRAHAVG